MAKKKKSKGVRTLFYLYDNDAKIFIQIRDGTVCGRTEGDLVIPDDDLVSGKHCQFKIKNNDVYIQDFGTTNKTRVNDVEIRSNVNRRIQLYDATLIARVHLEKSY